MPQIDFRPNGRKYNRPQQGLEVIRDFSKLERTYFDEAKADFTSFEIAQNVIHKGANARVRKGFVELSEPTESLGIHICERSGGNVLYSVLKDGASNSKITEINRTTGAQTDKISSITGQGQPSMTSLRGFLYMGNGGGDARKYDGTTASTLALPTGNARLVANDGSRLWAVSDDSPEEILYFSEVESGGVTSFDSSGTALTRGGIADSSITKYTAVFGIGKYIIACGANKTEVFKIPSFDQITQFTADMSVKLYTFDNVGVESKNAVYGVGDYVFVKTNDGTLHKIYLPTGAKEEIRDDLLTMESLDWGTCAMGYDQKENLLFITGRTNSGGVNDKTIVYSVLEKNFSIFTNIFAKEWTQDDANIYFLTNNSTIEDAFGESQRSDNGSGIPVRVRTQASYLGTEQYYKKAEREICHLRIWENTTIKFSVFGDRAVNGVSTADYINELTISNDPILFSPYPQPLGLGPWGGAGFTMNFENFTEVLRTREKINVLAVRFQVQLEATVTNDFEIRELGLTYRPTQKPTNSLTFDR